MFAMRVETGEILWTYQANLDPAIGTVICCGWTSRGVGLGDGRVYVGQLDGKFVALDQRTGAAPNAGRRVRAGRCMGSRCRGSGKTCAARRVLTQLHTGLYRVLYVSLSTGNVMDLFKTISWEMGLSVERSRAALYRQIKSEVSRLCADARTRPILVVD